MTKQHLEQHILPSVITLVHTNDWSRHLLLESACMNEMPGEQTELEATINVCTNNSTHYPV